MFFPCPIWHVAKHKFDACTHFHQDGWEEEEEPWHPWRRFAWTMDPLVLWTPLCPFMVSSRFQQMLKVQLHLWSCCWHSSLGSQQQLFHCRCCCYEVNHWRLNSWLPLPLTPVAPIATFVPTPALALPTAIVVVGIPKLLLQHELETTPFSPLLLLLRIQRKSSLDPPLPPLLLLQQQFVVVPHQSHETIVVRSCGWLNLKSNWNFVVEKFTIWLL